MNRFSTKAIHEGCEPEPTSGAVISPIFLTTTYAQEAPAEHRGYEYTRAGNPNFTIFERQLAALEGAKHATVFSSGLGALSALLSTYKPGDHVIALEGLYGGTFRLFKQVFEKFGIHFTLIPHNKLDKIEKWLAEKPKLLLFETPTNPLLDIYDIKSISQLTQKHQVTLLVDNTFATPYFQNPLQLGADIVWHSCTKYIGGHSDVLGGALITNNQTINESVVKARMYLGFNPSPFDVWLLSRSVKTLALRMEKHQSNAMAVATFLSDHPLVKRVYYPGLPNHPHHETAKQQMSGFSGIVSAEFNLSIELSKRLISSFQYFTLAESLGGIESLVNHPASMTHASIPKKERDTMGITDALVRFSVGIEDEADLIEDLAKNLELVTPQPVS